MKIKQRITSAARELFFRHGIRSITMDDIASHLGISKKTLYSQFPDKDKIIRQIMKDYLQEKQTIFTEISAKSLDSVHEIVLIMKHMSEMFGTINPKLFYDLHKYYPSAWGQFGDFKEDCIIGTVRENLKRGIRQGLYRKELNVNILAKLRIEEVECGMNPDIFPPKEFDLHEVHHALLDHYLYGISTPKGMDCITKYKKTMNF